MRDRVLLFLVAWAVLAVALEVVAFVCWIACVFIPAVPLLSTAAEIMTGAMLAVVLPWIATLFCLYVIAQFRKSPE